MLGNKSNYMTANNDKKEYHIVRYFAQEGKPAKHRPKGYAENMTLKEARAHCSRPDTHDIKSSFRKQWFDGYTKN